VSGPTPRRLLHFVTRRLRLRRYLQDRETVGSKGSSASFCFGACWLGQILRQSSFHAVEALVRFTGAPESCSRGPFSEDALSYFTERLDPGPTGKLLFSIVQRAKRNKPLRIAAGSAWPSMAPARDGEPSRVARSVARSATHSNRSSAINTISSMISVREPACLCRWMWSPMGLEIASMLPDSGCCGG